MRKLFVIVALVGLVAVPAALADASPQAPGAYCVAHKDQIGTVSGKLYATMAACVKAQRALRDQNVVNAAKTCVAEKADANFAANHGGKTFDQVYGAETAAGKSKNAVDGSGNAFGKCVSSKANAKTAEQQTAQTNAVKKCRTPEMKLITGAGKTYKNFGACVKTQTKAATS